MLRGLSLISWRVFLYCRTSGGRAEESEVVDVVEVVEVVDVVEVVEVAEVVEVKALEGEVVAVAGTVGKWDGVVEKVKELEGAEGE
jgi:hypothetical protein